MKQEFILCNKHGRQPMEWNDCCECVNDERKKKAGPELSINPRNADWMIEQIKKYNFPKWLDAHSITNFLGMWTCFDRTYEDYIESKNFYIERKITPENGGQATFPSFITADGDVTGEFYYKWNNIGYIFDGKKVYTVSLPFWILEN